MEVELATVDEVAARKALWLAENPDSEPSTCKQWNKKWQYTDERNRELERIRADYRLSEKKRKKIMARAKMARAKLIKQAEDRRWDKIYKEKFEDKGYYGLRPGRKA